MLLNNCKKEYTEKYLAANKQVKMCSHKTPPNGCR